MAIIYVDVTEIENSKSANITLKGGNEEEKVQEIIKFYEQRNAVKLQGTIITVYNQIVEEIKKQLNYGDISDFAYWDMKTDKRYMVIMLNDNMTLSYDYFLVRENAVDEYHCYTAYNDDDFDFKMIYQHNRPAKLTKKEMIKDVALLESNNITDVEYECEENRIKKILFTDKAGIAQKLKNVVAIDEKKVTEKEMYDYYKLVFLLYYLDKHGIPDKDVMSYKKIKVLDNISKPCIQMIPNYIEHTYVSSSAEENDLLKNEIIKHLSLKQIKRANRIYVQLLYCYTMVFEYIGKLLDVPIDMVIEERELCNIEKRLDNCFDALKRVEDIEGENPYEDSVWELAYHRYKGYILNCEREDSYNSLKYAFELGEPETPKLFDIIPNKYKYAEIHRENITVFIKENAEWFAHTISNGCTKRWINDHCEAITKACLLMEKFNRKYEFDAYPFTIVISAAQSVYEVQKNKLKYENRSKGYKGNKKVSLYASLDGMDEKNGDVVSFEYAWTAIIKRWCNYNENKYSLWRHSINIDLKFTELMRRVVKLNSIDDIDILVEGLFAETALPENSRMTGIKQIVEEEFYELKTGYELMIQDIRVLREFEHERVKDYFMHIMNEVVPFNEQYYFEEEFEFHLNMEYMAIKFRQNKIEKQLYLIDMRYLRLGNQYSMFRRAMELGLPWFTEDFTDF